MGLRFLLDGGMIHSSSFRFLNIQCPSCALKSSAEPNSHSDTRYLKLTCNLIQSKTFQTTAHYVTADRLKFLQHSIQKQSGMEPFRAIHRRFRFLSECLLKRKGRLRLPFDEPSESTKQVCRQVFDFWFASQNLRLYYLCDRSRCLFEYTDRHGRIDEKFVGILQGVGTDFGCHRQNGGRDQSSAAINGIQKKGSTFPSFSLGPHGAVEPRCRLAFVRATASEPQANSEPPDIYSVAGLRGNEHSVFIAVRSALYGLTQSFPDSKTQLPP